MYMSQLSYLASVHYCGYTEGHYFDGAEDKLYIQLQFTELGFWQVLYALKCKLASLLCL